MHLTDIRPPHQAASRGHPMSAVDHAVAALIAARNERRPVPAVELPDDASAYAVQAGVATALGWFGDAAPRHWKSGGPGLDAPQTHAPLPPDGVFDSPADLRQWPFQFRGIEAEIALRLGEAVDARRAAELDVDGCGALVDAMCVSIELVDSRWSEARQAPQLAKLADLQSHGALVLGAWVPFEARDWAQQRCEVRIGKRRTAGAHRHPQLRRSGGGAAALAASCDAQWCGAARRHDRDHRNLVRPADRRCGRCRRGALRGDRRGARAAVAAATSCKDQRCGVQILRVSAPVPPKPFPRSTAAVQYATAHRHRQPRNRDAAAHAADPALCRLAGARTRAAFRSDHLRRLRRAVALVGRRSERLLALDLGLFRDRIGHAVSARAEPTPAMPAHPLVRRRAGELCAAGVSPCRCGACGRPSGDRVPERGDARPRRAGRDRAGPSCAGRSPRSRPSCSAWACRRATGSAPSCPIRRRRRSHSWLRPASARSGRSARPTWARWRCSTASVRSSRPC